MRNTFAMELAQHARCDSSIFLLTGDLGFSVLEPFANAFPDRFLNVGIAEQNMVGIGSGLAKEGYKVFVYSIGNFPTLRCMEQIRYDICYHELNVKIIAVGAGYAYGPLGVSHHTTEDLGMLRTIPRMVVAAPCDPREVSALTTYFVENPGPGYMRLNKTGEPCLHSELPKIRPGTPLRILPGKDRLVIATGAIVHEAFAAAKAHGWELWSFPIISPMCDSWVSEVGRFSEITTLEEHQLNSGFGSAILEIINDAFQNGTLENFPKIHRVGIPNTFLSFSGSQDYLRKKAGLSIDDAQ